MRHRRPPSNIHWIIWILHLWWFCKNPGTLKAQAREIRPLVLQSLQYQRKYRVLLPMLSAVSSRIHRPVGEWCNEKSLYHPYAREVASSSAKRDISYGEQQPEVPWWNQTWLVSPGKSKPEAKWRNHTDHKSRREQHSLGQTPRYTTNQFVCYCSTGGRSTRKDPLQSTNKRWAKYRRTVTFASTQRPPDEGAQT